MEAISYKMTGEYVLIDHLFSTITLTYYTNIIITIKISAKALGVNVDLIQSNKNTLN